MMLLWEKKQVKLLFREVQEKKFHMVLVCVCNNNKLRYYLMAPKGNEMDLSGKTTECF